uniref:Uncharacterized protein n=1 Tax=Sphaerodactylus townsendi TaxID=933632 RepID=A0ACB8ELP4_9SAUR
MKSEEHCVDSTAIFCPFEQVKQINFQPALPRQKVLVKLRRYCHSSVVPVCSVTGKERRKRQIRLPTWHFKITCYTCARLCKARTDQEEKLAGPVGTEPIANI